MGVFDTISQRKIPCKIKQICVSHRFNLLAIVPDIEKLSIVWLYRFRIDDDLKKVWTLEKPNQTNLPSGKKVKSIESVAWRTDGKVLGVLYSLEDHNEESEKVSLINDVLMSNSKSKNQALLRLVNLEGGTDVISVRIMQTSGCLNWFHASLTPSSGKFHIPKVDIDSFFDKKDTTDVLQKSNFFLHASKIKTGIDDSFQEISDSLKTENDTQTEILNYSSILNFTTVHSGNMCYLYAYGINPIGYVSLSADETINKIETIINGHYKIVFNETHSLSFSKNYVLHLQGAHEIMSKIYLNFRQLLNCISAIEEVYDEYFCQVLENETRDKFKKVEDLTDFILTGRHSPELAMLLSKHFTTSKISFLKTSFMNAVSTIQKLFLAKFVPVVENIVSDLYCLKAEILKYFVVEKGIDPTRTLVDCIPESFLTETTEQLASLYKSMCNKLDFVQETTERYDSFSKWLEIQHLAFQKSRHEKQEEITVLDQKSYDNVLDFIDTDLYTEDRTSFIKNSLEFEESCVMLKRL